MPLPVWVGQGGFASVGKGNALAFCGKRLQYLGGDGDVNLPGARILNEDFLNRCELSTINLGCNRL